MNSSQPSRTGALAIVFVLVMVTVPVVTLPQPASAAPVDCSRGTNLSFETPLVRDDPMGPPPNWALFHEDDVPGWITSATDDQIELWESTFLGVTSYTGDQHAEMNANQVSILSQDFATLEGDSVDWAVAHRGRAGVDAADVRFGPPGSPVVVAMMSTGTSGWVVYSDTYVVPAGQTTTRLSFDSTFAAGGATVGNFLDGIMLELECELGIVTSFDGFTDVDSSGHTNPGDEAALSYLVTNEGSATIENLSVDDLLGFSATCPSTTLMPGESTTCTGTYLLTAADVDSGSLDSDATASAEDAAGVSVSESNTLSQAIEPEPSIEIVKTATLDDTFADPPGRVDEGDMIFYSFAVSNTGNVTLDPVVISDPTAGSVACPETDLASGEMMTCSASIVLSQAQIDTGAVANTATATGTPPGRGEATDDSSASVTLPALPGIALTKTATLDDTVVEPSGRVDVGDQIDFGFHVENTGNVTLTAVTVTDPTVGSVSCPVTTLAPGDDVDCTATLTLTQGDIDAGTLSNTATATGTPPTGPNINSTPDSTETDLPADPLIGIAKSLTSLETQDDGTIDIELLFTVGNYGNVTLSNLVITDDVVSLFAGLSPTDLVAIDGTLTGSATWDGTASSNVLEAGQALAPGESGTVSVAFTVTASMTTTIENTATSQGTAPDASEATDDSVDGLDPDADSDGDPTNDQSPTPVAIPGLYDLAVVKTGVEGPDAGQATWTVTVTNNGPATAPGPIVVEDTAGTGLTIVSAAGTGWSCVTTDSTATCTHGAGLGVGESSAITLLTEAEPGTSVSNTAEVTPADGNEVGSQNNSNVLSLVIGDLPLTGVDGARLWLLGLLLVLFGAALVKVQRKAED